MARALLIFWSLNFVSLFANASSDAIKRELFINYLGHKFKMSDKKKMTEDLLTWLNKEDRNFIRKRLINGKLIEKARVQNGSILLHLNGVTKKLEIINMDKGIYRFDGSKFRVRHGTPIEDAYQIVEKVLHPKTSSLRGLLVSKAHASINPAAVSVFQNIGSRIFHGNGNKACLVVMRGPASSACTNVGGPASELGKIKNFIIEALDKRTPSYRGPSTIPPPTGTETTWLPIVGDDDSA